MNVGQVSSAKLHSGNNEGGRRRKEDVRRRKEGGRRRKEGGRRRKEGVT